MIASCFLCFKFLRPASFFWVRAVTNLWCNSQRVDLTAEGAVAAISAQTVTFHPCAQKYTLPLSQSGNYRWLFSLWYISQSPCFVVGATGHLEEKRNHFSASWSTNYQLLHHAFSLKRVKTIYFAVPPSCARLQSESFQLKDGLDELLAPGGPELHEPLIVTASKS